MTFSQISRIFLLSAATLPAAFACGQSAPARQWQPIDTMKQAYAVAGAPNEVIWSPDGKTLTYLAPDGDLMAVDPATAKVTALVSHDKLDSVMHPQISEKDADHRNRYKTSSYLYAPDSSHILFDAGGELWVYDLKTGTGVNVANSGAGSGDDPKFSPDAQYVSYVKDHNLFIRSLRGTPERNMTNTHEATMLNGEVDWVYEEELDVRTNYEWAPDAKAIAFLQANEAKVPVYPIVDWVETHATTDSVRYPQPGDPNPDVRIGVAGLDSYGTHWIHLPISAGNDYIPRFGWINPKTLWIETLTRDHKHRNIYFAEAKTGNAHVAIEESTEKYFDEDYDVRVLRDKPLLIYTSWRDGYNHISSYKFDRDNPMAGATLDRELESGSYDVGDIDGVDEASGVVYYQSGESDPREDQVWAVKLDGSGKHRVTKSHGYNKGYFSEAADHFAVESSDTLVLPVMSMCAASGDCQPYWHGPAVDASLTLRAPEEFTANAADGTVLYASLLMPAGAAANASVPLINNPYGGPHAQEVTFRFSAQLFFDQMMTEHGFAILHAENRGMGGHGRDFEWAAYRNFGRVQLQDQLAVIDQTLAKHAQLDAKRLGWWGWSWGGTFTLNAMTHSDRFLAGVAVAPVTDWRNYDSIYTERYMGIPAENAAEYKSDSAVTNAKDLKGKLLLVQGTGDDNVHMSNVIQMINEFVDNGVPYDLQLYPRKTHSIAGIESRTHLYTKILSHFEHNLKEQK